VLKTTLRTLWSHKRRLISTALSILLGVAFMAGTLVLSDTINKVFDDLFDTINEEIDVAVQGEELFDAQFGGGGAYRAKLPESLVAEVGDVEGIEAASGAGEDGSD
jgi:putative ABC transport system permease protein